MRVRLPIVSADRQSLVFASVLLAVIGAYFRFELSQEVGAVLRLVLIIIFLWPFESFVSAVLLCLSSDGIDGLSSI